MARARIRVEGGLAAALQAFWGATMSAYSGCCERDGGIRRSKRCSRTELVRVCGARSVGRMAGQWRSWPSGGERQRSESSEGATELGFPGPTLGQLQSEAARRAGEPSGHGRSGVAGSWWSRSARPEVPNAAPPAIPRTGDILHRFSPAAGCRGSGPGEMVQLATPY